MANDNPACLKCDLDTAKRNRGDFFLQGVTDFSITVSESQEKMNNAITFKISFNAMVSSSITMGKDENLAIKPTGFELNKTEYEQLAKKEIIFFEIITDDSQSKSTYALDVKQVPKLEMAPDGTLTISLLLVNYWIGGQGKIYKDGSLPGEASNNAKKNPGIIFPI